jgi:hypothetical protein
MRMVARVYEGFSMLSGRQRRALRDADSATKSPAQSARRFAFDQFKANVDDRL